MGLQDIPRCYVCKEKIEGETPVFEAPCGHDGCASACWHGVHLMQWRERKAAKQAESR